jgi:hypothetical protein
MSTPMAAYPDAKPLHRPPWPTPEELEQAEDGATEDYARAFRRAEAVYRYTKQFRYAWDESKHPRQADGKFGEGPGESAAPKRKPAKGQQALFDESTGTSRVAVGEKLGDAIDSSAETLINRKDENWSILARKIDPQFAKHIHNGSLPEKLAHLGITQEDVREAFSDQYASLDDIHTDLLLKAFKAAGLDWSSPDTPKETRWEFSGAVRKVLEDHFNENSHLLGNLKHHDELAAAYKAGMRKSMRGLSAKARERIAKGTAGGMKAYANQETVQNVWEERAGRPSNFSVGGFYSRADNTIHNVAQPGYESVYAHEFAHALDCGGSGQFELSSQQEWVDAFLEEIQSQASRDAAQASQWRGDWWQNVKDSDTPLSAYATQSTWEGFAEFGRAVYETATGENKWRTVSSSDGGQQQGNVGKLATAKGLEGLKKAFPKCYAFWEKHGLIDAVDQYRRHLAEQFKAYYARIK